MNPSFDNADNNMGQRELELEIARLNAEVEALRGEGDPTDVAARFLAMAANTVDQAMEEARREADEFAAEISAEAEARRDEATRIAEEATARAETLRFEAEQSESAVHEAETKAEEIRVAAEKEAAELIATERTRLADELEVLSGVRTALEEERGALESYHEELQRRVQELAESMVSFMTTEPPLAALQAIDDLGTHELGWSRPDDAESTEAVAEPEHAEAHFEPENSDRFEMTVGSEGTVEPDPLVSVDSEVEASAAFGEPVEPEPAGDQEDDDTAEMAFVDYVIEPAPDVPEVPDPAPAPPSFHDMLSASAADEFGGAPVVDDPGDAPTQPIRGGLFGRATDDEQDGSSSLFGAHGARLIEQTSPDQLAAALAESEQEDERFRSFIDGDDDADPSRDWLLRPEQH